MGRAGIELLLTWKAKILDLAKKKEENPPA
jgi:hypothetical protein